MGHLDEERNRGAAVAASAIALLRPPSHPGRRLSQMGAVSDRALARRDSPRISGTSTDVS